MYEEHDIWADGDYADVVERDWLIDSLRHIGCTEHLGLAILGILDDVEDELGPMVAFRVLTIAASNVGEFHGEGCTASRLVPHCVPPGGES